MSDTLILTGPSGSSMNLASYVLADPGWDTGEADLLKAAYAESPAAEGGWLAFETVNHRTMQFPVRIASTSAFTSAGAAAWMRTLARPGATLDVLLDGVATAEAIRFDVLSGRYENAQWDTFKFIQTDRFDGTLKLDVQPFGYWPTMILLASSASVGAPGVLNLTPGASGVAASVIGDAPGPAAIFIGDNGGNATNFPAGSWVHDTYAWSLGARPSFSAQLNGASFTDYVGGGTLVGDGFAPGSQALEIYRVAGSGWIQGAVYQVGAALEPAYRGHYRAFVFAKLMASQLPWYASVDADTSTNDGALASSAPVATLVPGTATGTPGIFGAQPSPAYTLIDAGEIALPPVGSGYASWSNLQNVRLWLSAPTSNLGIATSAVRIGGIYLLPLGGPAGVLPRGLRTPTIAATSAFAVTRALRVDGITQTSLLVNNVFNNPADPIHDAGGFYRGQVPRVGASTVQLDVLAGARKSGASGATGPVAYSSRLNVSASVQYRPRFAFLKGL